MAYSVNWITRVVTVPQSDLTPISADVFELDVLSFWAEIHDIQDGEGMPYDTIMASNAPVSLSGLTLARTVEVINGYRIEFEDGAYQVNLTGANNNILDARVQNQVSINANNSAGLQVVDAGAGGGHICAQDVEFSVGEPQLFASLSEYEVCVSLPDLVTIVMPEGIEVGLPEAIQIEACRC